MAEATISKPTYELSFDRLEGSYTIRRVQEIGPFASREAARQYMLETEDERKANDG